MNKYHIQIPHKSIVIFKPDKKPIYCHQDLYYVYETQVGKIVRLKQNSELCGTDFNANVDDLIIVGRIK